MNRKNSIKRAGIFGIAGNLFLLIIKGTVGFITNSQAMIADAANSAGDIFASLMTFIGNKIASVPQDADHNFGHGKAEYIFSLFISLSMIGISLKLLYDSLISLPADVYSLSRLQDDIFHSSLHNKHDNNSLFYVCSMSL